MTTFFCVCVLNQMYLYHLNSRLCCIPSGKLGTPNTPGTPGTPGTTGTPVLVTRIKKSPERSHLKLFDRDVVVDDYFLALFVEVSPRDQKQNNLPM